MPSHRNRATRKSVVTGALFLTMSMSVIACAGPADHSVADTAQIPLGDWWPAPPSGDLGAVANPAARAHATAPEFALGDWWPDAAEVHEPAALAATPTRGEPLPVVRNDR